MTDQPIEYRFIVNNVTPETMPFGRLVAYYHEIVKMLAPSAAIHLVSIEKGSHASRFRIEQGSEDQVGARLRDLGQDSAPKNAMAAYKRIGEMLEEDKASGTFSDCIGHNIIQFPGDKPKTAAPVRVRDVATITGELYHISGTDTDVRIRLKTDLYGVVYATVTKELAKRLKNCLFGPIKASGRALWTQTGDGGWAISDFTITDFIEAKQENLEDAVYRLRGLEIDWPQNTIAQLNAFDEKSG